MIKKLDNIVQGDEFHSEVACRVCGVEGHLLPVLDLGDQPLANAFLQEQDILSEKFYPLTLVCCDSCKSLQIRETVPKETLFENYFWLSGTSAVTRNFAHTFSEQAIDICRLQPEELVLEIASNDGTFLKPFKKGGYRTVGVDPAKNIASLAQREGIETINEFWNTDTAESLLREHGEASFVFGRNVIAHVEELKSVLVGMKHIIGKNGKAALEFHSALSILENAQYDSIYHEHLCYHSLHSISLALEAVELFPWHVQRSPISGGALVVYFSKEKLLLTDSFKQQWELEKRAGLENTQIWIDFGTTCYHHREKIRSLFLNKSKKEKWVGFGASARSATFLNFCNLKYPDLLAIIDNNPLKQGCYSPGTKMPIVSLESALKLKPDVIFILAWNFAREIEASCRQAGYNGRFITAFQNKDLSETICHAGEALTPK